MELILQIAFALLALIFLTSAILYWLGKKKLLQKVLNYSTILMLVLATLLLITLILNGNAFQNVVKPYF